MAVQSKPNPLTFALMHGGYVSPEQAGLADINQTISKAVNEVSETAKAQAGAEALRTLIQPKQVDPLEQAAKGLSVMQSMMGVRSATEEAERRREEQERRERQEAERREEDRRRAEQADAMSTTKMMMEFMKMIHESSKDSQKETREFMAHTIEQMNKQHQDLLKSLEEKARPKESEIDSILKQKALQEIMNPYQGPTIEEQYKQAHQLATVFGFNKPQNTDDIALKHEEIKMQHDFRREELRLQRELEERKLAADEKKTEALLQALGGFASRFQGQPNPQTQPKQEEKPLGRIVCPNCGAESIHDLTNPEVECPICHEELVIRS